MPKRKSEDKLAYYRKKLRKLEEKVPRPRIRWLRLPSTSDSSNSENESDNGVSNDVIDETPSQATAETTDQVNADTNNQSAPELPADQSQQPVSVTEPQQTDPELDPDVLLALGAKTADEPEYGDKIHENLAQLWLPLLKKGMSKDDKEKLLKDYLVPQNCTLLQAPKLNPEISAAISENARNRDKKLISAQQQLGAGVTAINRAMSLLLNNKTDFDRLKTIKHLSDACRILSDLHYVDTQARIKLITPSLDKSFLNVIQDNRRDTTLFGKKLGNKIKASKTIEKQGLQIKKPINPAPSTSTSRSNPTQARGNWSGPPRYTANKSSRGGGKKPSSTSRKAPPAAAPLAKPASKPQTRAQAQQ